jgi:hypothetical protein
MRRLMFAASFDVVTSTRAPRELGEEWTRCLPELAKVN